MFFFLHSQDYNKNAQADIPECRPISKAKFDYAREYMETRILDPTRLHHAQLVSDPMKGIHAYPQPEAILSALNSDKDDSREKVQGVIRPQDAYALIKDSVGLTNGNFSQDDANNCMVFGLTVLEKTLQLPHQQQPEILVITILAI